MHLSGTRHLYAFGRQYSDATRALSSWVRNIKKRSFRNFADIRNTFGSADLVGPWIIFDIRGNKYRLVTTMDLVSQSCHVEAIFTHANYDRKHWMKTLSAREPTYLGWGPFEHASTVSDPTNEREYDSALAVVTQLGKWGASDASHPQNALLGMVLKAIRAYERVHYPI
jgi:mRNA interferase HigB